MLESDTSDGGHWKSKSKRRKPTGEKDLAVPLSCKEVDPFTTWIRNFKSLRKTRMPNNVKTYDGTGDPKDHVKIFQGAAQQNKYVKYLVEIHNIKQRDKETIEDFMKRFKVKTRHIKGAPECMQISRLMHRVNNPKLIKRLDEHVPKTMEEMMITTTAFIRGETTVASKKKGHTSWKPQDQPSGTFQSGDLNFEVSQRKDRGLVGDVEHSTKVWMNFMIVKSLSQYNGVIRRLGIREIQAVPSTAHGMLKFLVDGEIITIRMTILIPTECTVVTTTSKEILKEAEENLDIFTLHPSDIMGVSRSIVEHRLNIQEGYPLVRHKKRGQASERARAIQVEVQKLVEAGIMREVYYHDWLSNPVMVKKHDGSWRMCMDFIDLNKACSQDCYPLPEIDWKVESLCGYPFNVMLGEHNITSWPRTSVKGHILADFLLEKPDKAPPVVETPQESWTLFTDGSSCVDGSGASLILTSPEGTKFTYALRFQFTTSNNEEEYEALIAGLRIATQMGAGIVHVSVDSKLVVNQVLGTYVAKEENIIKYLEKTKSLVNGFTNFSISQVSRSKNKKADALSKIASTSFAHLSKQVLFEVLKEKSIQEKEVATVVEEDGPA
nr:reverse transcriptase domain-containing protein [Tanacetum cinerariifolium]